MHNTWTPDTSSFLQPAAATNATGNLLQGLPKRCLSCFRWFRFSCFGRTHYESRLLQAWAYQATLTSAGNNSNDCTRICIIQTAIACFFTDLVELRLAMTRSYGNDSQCCKMGHGRRDILLLSYVWNEGLFLVFAQIWVWLVAVPFCEQCWRHWMNKPSKLLRL